MAKTKKIGFDIVNEKPTGSSFTNLYENGKLYGKINRAKIASVVAIQKRSMITLDDGSVFGLNQTVKQVSKILGI